LQKYFINIMNITFKLPNPQQHERIFLNDLMQRYKSRLISAADYILSLINIYRPKGQRLNVPSAKVFYEQFGIAKSTFYRALKRLENLPGLGFHWEPNGGISLWRGEFQEATPLTPEKKEPIYTKLKELSPALRNEFEFFVKNEWRKFKGEEIRSFHRFMEKPADFQNWWVKFQQHKMAAATAAATTAATAAATTAATAEIKRTFSPIPDSLKGLFGRKST
jgi:hypothetical protein